MVTISWKITKKTENIWNKILLYAKRNKLYSFEEEASHQKSENCTPAILANICQNEKNFFFRKYHQMGLQSAKLTARSDDFVFIILYLRYWVQIYCGCSASITFYEWNSISVIWPPRARLQRSILWTQFSTILAHISTGTLAISRWMLSLRSSKVAGLLA